MERIKHFITILLVLVVANLFAGTVTLNVADHNGSPLQAFLLVTMIIVIIM